MGHRSTSAGIGGPPSTGSPSTLRMRPSGAFANRSGDRPAGVAHLHAAGDPVGGAHGHRAHLVLPDVLLHLRGQLDRYRAAGVLDLDRVVDLGQVLRLELDVEHRADDLHDPAQVVLGLGGFLFLLGGDCSCHRVSLVSSVICHPERRRGQSTLRLLRFAQDDSVSSPATPPRRPRSRRSPG